MIMKTRILAYALHSSLFICLAGSLTLVSCNGNDAAAPADMRIETVALPAKDKASNGYVDEESKNEVDQVKFVKPVVATETKIIKTGDLRFQTDDLDKTYNQVQQTVKKYQASIKNDSQSNEGYQLTRSITIRIPNQNFDAFITDISKGVAYFDQKEISSEDVTEEYIDVASRIKTKKVLEERYYELLKKASKVSEMLEIEKKLSEIREEIEAKEGRLKYLESQVQMSTINIEFYKPVADNQQATVSYGGKMGNALVSGFNSISNFFIQLLGIWPVIVTLVVLFILIRKRIKRKKKNDAIED